MSNRKVLCIVSFFILILSTAIFVLINFTKFDFKNNAEKIYAQGLYFTKQKDYENAYYNFSKVPQFTKIYKYALLREAITAQKLNDRKTAIEKYHLFLKMYPKTILSPKAAYSLAKCYYEDNQLAKSYKLFLFIKKKYPKTDFAVASNYYLGLITKNKSEKIALEYFIKYLKLSENGRLCKNCIEQIKSLKTVEPNFAQKELIGVSSYKSGDYRNAILYLKTQDTSKNWSYLVSAYIKSGQTQTGRDLFLLSTSKYCEKIDKESLYESIELYVKTFSSSIGEKKGWEQVYRVLSKSSCKEGLDFVLYRISRFNKAKDNLNIYNTIINKYPHGDFASEALWELFWYYYSHESYKTAYILAKKHISTFDNTKASPRILFWMGKLAKKQGNNSIANGYFDQVVSKYPNDYYAFRAWDNLNPKKARLIMLNPKKLPEKDIHPQFPINYANLDPDDMNIVLKIVNLRDYELLEQIGFDSKFVDSWIQYELGNYATSSNFAKYALENLKTKPLFYDEVYKLAYPLHFAQKINSHADVTSVDPYLIISIIREESYFNKKATSHVNARGLMQLMPTTANYIASKSHILYNSLYDIDDNLKLGCAYFRYLLKEMNNPLLAVAAYNGGPNIVKYWHKNSKNSQDIDEVIENIPYSETKHYVRKVLSTYWNYYNIYK